MALPIKNGKVTTPFGKEGHMWKTGRHEGADFAVPDGTPFFAMADGVVESVGTAWGKAYGDHRIVIHHPGFGYVVYAHGESAKVKPGDKVKKGQELGKTGHSGNVTGPHLHVELQKGPGWTRGGGIDPDKLFKA